MARRSKASMIADYQARIAELEAKEQDKAKAASATAVETLALCDESEVKARKVHAKQVATADEMLAGKLARINLRREKAQAIINEVALGEKFNQLTQSPDSTDESGSLQVTSDVDTSDNT